MVLEPWRIAQLRSGCTVAAQALQDGNLRAIAAATRKAHDDAPMGDERTELSIAAVAYEDEIVRRKRDAL